MKNQANLYNKTSTKIMKASDKLSDMSYNRIELINDFAKNMNMKRIGIANCIMFSRETDIISNYLSKNFEVFTVDCKYGKLTGDELYNDGGRRILCNPAGQADYLNNKDTDLNISIGLCVGHDMIFAMDSIAPVTSVFTKDFTNNNNPAKAVQSILR